MWKKATEVYTQYSTVFIGYEKNIEYKGEIA